MKIKILYLFLLLLSLVIYSEMSLTKTLAKEITLLTNTSVILNIKTTYENYIKQDEIIKALSYARSQVSFLRTNLIGASEEVEALNLFANCVLETRYDAKLNKDQLDLWSKKEIIQLLILSANIAKIKANIIDPIIFKDLENTVSKFLYFVNNEIIPNYKLQPVFANIMPPFGVSNAFAGMSPEAIRDEKLRHEYEAALKRNSDNNFMNNRQRDLQDAIQEIESIFSYYLYRQYVGDKQKIAQLLAGTELQKEVKERILNLVLQHGEK